MDKSGNSKLKNDPFFIQLGTNLISLYIAGGELRVEHGFKFLAQICYFMYSKSSLVYWKDKSEELKIKKSQQKYNKPPFCVSVKAAVIYVDDRTVLLMRQQILPLA